MTNVILNAAMPPYNASAVAAPNPDISPASQPRVSVRDAHMTFTGPTGTAIAKPAIKPLDSNHRPINSPSAFMDSLAQTAAPRFQQARRASLFLSASIGVHRRPAGLPLR